MNVGPQRSGFTMIELMVTVLLVALLASIAIPIYGKHVKYGRVAEATARVGEIVTAARAYAMANPNARGDPIWPSGSSGIVNLSTTPNFSYAFSAGRGANARTTALQITATGRAGTRMAGVTVRVTVPNINLGAASPQITGL